MSLDFLNIHPLLKRYDIHPKKSLGQNFLVEPAGLTRAINAAELSGKEEVLEIGAGLGSLTYLLAQTCASVTAVEIDPRMLAPLSEALKPFANVRVVQGDILELDPASLVSRENYVVVANIPYYITSAIIRRLRQFGKVVQLGEGAVGIAFERRNQAESEFARLEHARKGGVLRQCFRQFEAV